MEPFLEHLLSDGLVLPLLAFFIFLVVFFMLRSHFDRQSLKDRLQRVSKEIKSSGEKKKKGENSLKSLFSKSRGFVDSLKSRNMKSAAKYREKFEKCGWDPSLASIVVTLSRIGLTIAFVTFFFILNTLYDPFITMKPPVKAGVFVFFIFLGLRGFDYIIDIMIKRRADKLIRHLPMTVDLLVVCVRAGLSLENALDRIAQELIYVNSDLARELAAFSAELSILPDRTLAYKNFARQIESPLVNALATSLMQAETQGVAIGNTLSVLSQEFTKHKMLEIEEKAAKLPAKLTVPVILLSLPAIGIIVLGPTIARVTESGFLSR